MTLLLSVTLKIAVLTLAALTATALLRRRSAAVRHWVLATTVFACVSIPPIELLLPAWPIPFPEGWSGTTVTSSISFADQAATLPADARSPGRIASEPSRSPLPRPAVVLGVIYAVGAAAGIGVLVAGLVRLRKLALGSTLVSSGPWRDVANEVSRRYRIRRPVRLLLCRHPTLLATWGLTKPAILLPDGALAWDGDRVHAVLRHELAHVARGDWLVILTANVLRAVNWFNPLLWLAYARLRHESERACDDLVLSSGISGSAYAAHLLDVARECARRRHPWSPAIAIAHHSMLERRVRAMLNARVNREPLTVFMRAATVAVIAAATVSVGVVTLSGETGVPAAAPARWVSSPILPVLPAVADPPKAAPAVARAVAQAVQAAGGTIEGVLYDPYGGLLPGAALKLTQAGTGSVQSGVTDRGGSFVFKDLASGDYELVTDLPGFISVKNVIRAESGAVVRRHITLPIGMLEETVHVTCARSDTAPSRPTAPTASTTPGPAQSRNAALRGVEPKIPATFTGGIGGQISVPRKIAHANPVCPSGAVPEPTVVRLVGRVGIDGLFSDLHSVSTDAQPPYVASALEASRQWAFTPTLLNGAPIEVNMRITVSYSWN